MDRRDILKALVGAPIALLAGGVILGEGATIEERAGSALVVPKQGISVARAPSDRNVITFMQAAIGDGRGIQLNFDTPPLIVPDGRELWLHIRNDGPLALISLVAARQGEEFTATMNGVRFDHDLV